MPNFTVPFDSVKPLSHRDIAYQLNPQQFSEIYAFDPTFEGLKEAINSRKNANVDRELLHKSLLDQAINIELSDAQKRNIDILLEENAFSVITAHQPSLLTGPAYFIIKILSTIKLAERLNKEVPDANVVPVFIIGSEDHDFEEINHLEIYGKKITWDSGQTGPVGRMDLAGLEDAINQFTEIAGNSENALEIKKLLADALEGSVTYNEFVYKMINRLFAKQGLIVANMDDKTLKTAFVPYMLKELTERKSEGYIKATQDGLEKIGFSSQAYPREINLFYMTEQSRERIVYEDGMFSVLHSNQVWDLEGITTELQNHPERFSPNVVMRPIFQEVIWPNIAYIGGGGELAYWLERKSQFHYFGVHFPVLIRRNSLMIVNKGQSNTMHKLGFDLHDLFLEEHELISRYLNNQTSFELDLDQEIKEFETMFESITNKAKLADKSLEGFAEAEKTRIIKQLEQIESRIKRTIKKQEETSVNQIKNLKSKLFPNNGLQERNDNFFQFYLQKGEAIYNELIEILDPLEKGFVVFYED